jgi:hypothetical protein
MASILRDTIPGDPFEIDAVPPTRSIPPTGDATMHLKLLLRGAIGTSAITLHFLAGCGSNVGTGERTGDMSTSPVRGRNAPGFGSSSPATRPATGEGGPGAGGFSAETGRTGHTNKSDRAGDASGPK